MSEQIMSGKFETVIVDADRKIEFDVTVEFESWSECGSRRYSVSAVRITGGRVLMDGLLSAGRRNTVYVDMAKDDLPAVCELDFARKYASELTDAMMDHVASLEDAMADYEMEVACV